MNSVDMIGNLTAKPQLKETANEKKFCDARIAVYRTKDHTDFIDIRAWEARAEQLGALDKGDKIAVHGSLYVDEYTTQSGTPAKRIYINVFGIDAFLPRREYSNAKEGNYGNTVPDLTPVDDELPF